MHSSTKKWKSSRLRAREEGQRKLKSRKHVCPNSPFFTEHFNFQHHDTKMLKEKDMYLERLQSINIPIKPFGGKIFADLGLGVFDETYQYNSPGSWEGKFLNTSCSPILCMPTVWQQNLVNNKHFVFPENWYAEATIASWPSVQEYKFEGPDRIVSDEKYCRHFPIPRNPCNQTVNWSLRPFLKPHHFDKILESSVPTEENILTHDLEIGLPDDQDLQVKPLLPTDTNKGQDTMSDDPYQGVKAFRLLGNDLLAALDPQNVYF